MAAVAVLVRTLARLVWRDLASFRSLQGNNLFAFVAFIAAMQPASASVFLLLFGGLILLFSSDDPLRKAPPERLALWPLTQGQRLIVRGASLAMTPVFLLAMALGIVTRRFREAATLLAVGIVVYAVHAMWDRSHQSHPSWDVRRLAPPFPTRLGGLVTLHLRQMFLLLETYVAAVLILAAQVYVHTDKKADASVLSVMAALAALAMSTHAQSLFGLDGRDTRLRYRLWPMRGWQALLAKDVAFLLVLAALVVTADLLVGLSAGLAALILGHRRSAVEDTPQRRWRFAGGELAPTGITQIVVLLAVGFGLRDNPHPLWLLLLAVVWAGSVWYHGRELEK